MKTLSLMVLKFWRDHPQWSGLITAIVSFILLQVLSGIISNSAYNWFQKIFLPWSTKVATISNITLLTIVLVSIFIGVIGWFIGKVTNIQTSKISPFEKNNYLRILHGIHSASYLELIFDINKQIQNNFDLTKNQTNLETLIDKFFLSLFDHFGTDIIQGGGILLPDEKSPDWLAFWRMSPDQPLSPKRFYIGKDAEKNNSRGAAGTAYFQDNLKIIKIKDAKSGISNDPSFHKFEFERPITPYLSFIILPIHWKAKVVGVLTIEGKEQDTFDFEDISWLQGLTDILGTILYLFGKVSD